MDDYRPNSYRSKSSGNSDKQKTETEQDKKIERVTKSAKIRKKSKVKELLDIFVQEDPENIKKYIIFDVIIPSIKKGVSDTVNMLLYGKKAKTDGRKSGTRVHYRSYYDSPVEDEPEPARVNSDYNNIVVDSEEEAELLVKNMNGVIKRYGVISVADFFDMVGLNHAYTDNKFGWTNLSGVKIIRVSDGYSIKLPKAMALD